ncbi:unnamed protein product [Durusdinium trenchii]|uniref:Uncharacterized protein n=2 Tax=Durusdinium trenchii TaxID=1381693 RepID=A0ABP0QSQ3_9DINO
MAKNAQLELKASATTLAIWDWSDRLLYGAHVFWMIKEIGWVLLVPEICLPAGLAAGLLMIIGVIAHACRRDFANVLPEMVMCIWLCSNVTWMASEVLMDDPDAKFSWHLCPVLHGDHQSEYDTMSVMVADGFLLSAGLYVLGVAYLICVHRRLKGPVGRVLLQCYLCSWCLKDYFWADEDFWPAISTDLVTVPMLLYNIHLESGICSASLASFAWLSWTLANGIWIVGELKFPGETGFNISAACLLTLALVFLGTGYQAYKASERVDLCPDSSSEDSCDSISANESC